MTVQPGGILSLQYHHRRDKLCMVLNPGAQVEVGGRILWPERGERVVIPHRTTHRLSAVGDEAVRVLEVSFGEFDEDDIVRLEDIYGRMPANGNAQRQ
jgi:mannose-6-phosphate isomerase